MKYANNCWGSAMEACSGRMIDALDGKSIKGCDFSAEGFNFVDRHIGPRREQIRAMLSCLGCSSLEELLEKIIPSAIRFPNELKLKDAVSEDEALGELLALSAKNEIWRSYIGLGFHGCITPAVLQRCILDNPGWYTQYTPYQAEIAQGRLEALFNFQTMVADLTGMDIANASLLDEGSAASEAMAICMRAVGSAKRFKFFVASNVHQTTLDVIQTRAAPLGIQVVVGTYDQFEPDSSFIGMLLPYLATDGVINDFRSLCSKAKLQGLLNVVTVDLLSLVLLSPPSEWGADIVVGNSQRFGVPLFFGGPHAAFIAVRNQLKRDLPGRLVGLSKDRSGKPAYRLALQTREQHIRREKATSNICTAQVLLAVVASSYAVYHGPDGLTKIATEIGRKTSALAKLIEGSGIKLRYSCFFDTIRTEPLGQGYEQILARAKLQKINLRIYGDHSLGLSLDESCTLQDLFDLCKVFCGEAVTYSEMVKVLENGSDNLPDGLRRAVPILKHPVFNSYHSEQEMTRYLYRLQSKDLSLTTSMIPLGSCTMKLNAAAEMLPVSWPQFSQIHPFAPSEQTAGYLDLIRQLEIALAEITGLSAVSLQPNAGSQGEYAGLLTIRNYHQSCGADSRKICLIPRSAHGTNPASAVLAGFEVVSVECDASGNIDLNDLEAKATKHSNELGVLMVTYPSTHGVFEEGIVRICKIVHQHGGQVYMDGANMNAQVGLCRPGDFGVDVCHLNLHKTFSIPHGGGGPGVGPIACAAHLAAFLPGHSIKASEVGSPQGAVCSAPWGSAGVLSIPWVYIRMMGAQGLKLASSVAILNANYVAWRLNPFFPVLYRGKNGLVAHECILDLRNLKRTVGIESADVAKRLMDYGFHAPTVSFPVAETLMIEPTESESKEELDRFCDAMIAIHAEIEEIKAGQADRENNVLKNAPHTAEMATDDNWPFPYSREKAVYPLPYLRNFKFWPAVARIDNVWGDRNLCCRL